MATWADVWQAWCEFFRFCVGVAGIFVIIGLFLSPILGVVIYFMHRMYEEDCR